MASILDIEEIGPVYTRKLSNANIKTTKTLLKKGATPMGRKEIEKATGIGHKLILKWVNLVDLLRIKGVSKEYTDLLEEAGVDTLAELARRRADNLYEKILKVNKIKKLIRRPPSFSMVKNWISQAKKLPRMVGY